MPGPAQLIMLLLAASPFVVQQDESQSCDVHSYDLIETTWHCMAVKDACETHHDLVPQRGRWWDIQKECDLELKLCSEFAHDNPGVLKTSLPDVVAIQNALEEEDMAKFVQDYFAGVLANEKRPAAQLRQVAKEEPIEQDPKFCQKQKIRCAEAGQSIAQVLKDVGESTFETEGEFSEEAFKAYLKKGTHHATVPAGTHRDTIQGGMYVSNDMSGVFPPKKVVKENKKAQFPRREYHPKGKPHKPNHR